MEKTKTLLSVIVYEALLEFFLGRRKYLLLQRALFTDTIHRPATVVPVTIPSLCLTETDRHSTDLIEFED